MSMSDLQHCTQLHAAGRLEEAEAAYRALLAEPSDESMRAHQLLAVLLSDRGEAADALSHYDQALALGGASAELFFRRAGVLRSLGRAREALESYDRAIAKNPEYADAYHLRGVVLAALGRMAAAVESYDRAVALQPLIKNYWNNRGVALETLGRLDDAVTSYDRALGLDPGYLQAHHNRGSTLLKLGRLEDAVTSFDRALACNPNVAEPWNFRAVALASLDRHAEALESAERALAIRPNYPEAQNTRSVALRALKRLEEALFAAEAALLSRPGFPEALNSQGSALAKLGRFEEACASYRQALASKPDDASIQLNFGMALEALDDFEGAQNAFAAAQALAPEMPDPRHASALAHIRAGDLHAGFRLYEARWTQKGGPRHAYPEETLWLGEDPLGDRMLLVHAEQGFGDVIQFSRFAAMAAPPSQQILQVQPPLKRLMKSLDGAGKVLAVGEETPPFDLHIPVMSLPLALKIGLADIAPRIPYITATPFMIEEWRRKLPPANGPRVGVAWSGNPGHDNDQNRSMMLETLRPLLDEDAQFISLQKEHRASDYAALARTPHLIRIGDELGDFADTAALISCCDVVIAIDTAVAHLAGALGKPVWLMLPLFSDWRWQNGRDKTPWYPSATLFRQETFGDWDGVVRRVAAHLRRFALGGGR